MDLSQLDIGALSKLILDGVLNKDYGLVAVLILFAILLLIRKVGVARYPKLADPKVLVALTAGLSVLGALGNSLLAGAPLSAALVLKALLVALPVVGGLLSAGPREIRAQAEAKAAEKVDGLSAAIVELSRKG